MQELATQLPLGLQPEWHGIDLEPFERAAPPKWFVTLHGADHRVAFTDDESPYDELVTRTVLDFWHGTLDGDDEALARVAEDASHPTLSTVRHER